MRLVATLLLALVLPIGCAVPAVSSDLATDDPTVRPTASPVDEPTEAPTATATLLVIQPRPTSTPNFVQCIYKGRLDPGGPVVVDRFSPVTEQECATWYDATYLSCPKCPYQTRISSVPKGKPACVAHWANGVLDERWGKGTVVRNSCPP